MADFPTVVLVSIDSALADAARSPCKSFSGSHGLSLGGTSAGAVDVAIGVFGFSWVFGADDFSPLSDVWTFASEFERDAEPSVLVLMPRTLAQKELARIGPNGTLDCCASPARKGAGPAGIDLDAIRTLV